MVAVQRSIWAFAHLNDKDDVDMMDDLAKQLMQELKDQRKAHETQMKELMQQMQDMRQNPANEVVGGGGGGGNVVPRHPRDPADILREKHQSVFSNLMKCADLKCYKFAHQKSIREWLRAFDTKIDILTKAVELPMAELNVASYVNMVRSKLDDEVVQDVTIKFASCNPALQWDTIAKDRLQEFLIDQYEHKEPEVAALLHVFGNKRFKKTTEDVKSHRSKFWDKLPTFVKPKDEAGRVKLVDILQRTLYYTSLDDAFIQEKLFEIPEAEQSYVKFYEAAVLAEAQRAHYKSATVESNVLDSSSAVSIHKVENLYPKSRDSY